MTQANTKPRKKSRIQYPNGRDEMNLAEFPFASLRRRGDRREAIVHESWVVDKNGNRHHQTWVVRGLLGLGLPTEFDERVYVALMAITVQGAIANRKVPFSIYQILKIMGLVKSKRTYQDIEESLKRLVGVTIYSEGAFWDNENKERVTMSEAFHLIEKYWLRYKENKEEIREAEGVPGYIVWGEDIWRSIQANYIKPLNLEFFYSLESPTARRLYRFLDKRMRYQQEYEIDIFELASRLGMVRYSKPAWVKRKLQPAFDDLIAKGFLKSARAIKHKKYTRIRFVKAPKAVPASQPDEGDETEDLYQYPEREGEQQAESLPSSQMEGSATREEDLWEQVLREINLSTTKAAYQSWLPHTTLLSLKDNTAVIGVPDEATGEWLANRLAPVVKRAIEAIVEREVAVEFVVAAAETAAE